MIRFAKKYKMPINSSFGEPDEENLNNPETIRSNDPATATI